MSDCSTPIFIKMASLKQTPSSNVIVESCQVEHCTCGGLPGKTHSFQDSTPAFSSNDVPNLNVKELEEGKNHNETEEQCEFPTLESNGWALIGLSFISCA
jgi:hypothetical protein